MLPVKIQFLNLIRQFTPVVATLFVTTGIAISQSYYHSPNDTLTAITTVDNSVTMNITQVHPGNDTLRFIWTKLSVAMPPEWTATICDNNTCYPDLMDTEETLPVLPGDDGLMLIHCYPFTTSGIGVIRYTIYELNTPQQVDTLTWIIDATTFAETEELSEKTEPFSLAGNTFILTNENSDFTGLKLLNLNGEVLFTHEILPLTTLTLPHLTPNMYLLELNGKKTTIQRKIWYPNN